MPIKVPTSEEARLNGRKGGQTASKNRAERKEAERQLRILKDTGLLDALLQAEAPEKVQDQIKKQFGGTLPEGVKLTNEYALILRQIHQGIYKGNLPSTQFVMDRAYGKPVSTQEITGKDGGAINVNQTVDVDKLKEIKDALDD